MTLSRSTAAIAWRYALAPACIGAALLLRMSPLGPFFYPTEPFILGVLVAAWFGGVGPGVFAALLSSATVPQLIALTQLPSTEYRLLWGFFDLPRFIPLGLTGAAVGWGASSLRRAEKALREHGRELSKARDELETAVAERTAHLAASEEALRESQQRHERVMLASDAGIWDWDVAKDEFYVSPRFLEMGGLPPDTVFSGREDFMRRGTLHPQDREKWQREVRQLFASGGSRLTMELRSIVKGETRWHRLEGICFRDASGRVARWTGSTTDISERKRAEEALRRSEERFALALAASNDGIWDWDIVTDQQFFSGRAQRTLGLEPGPTVRLRSEWHALREYHPEDAPRRIASLERHLAGETPVYEGEWRVRPVGGNAGGNAGGEYRWIQARGLCVRDADGRAIRMVGSLTEIDGRKRMEAALRQSEERYSLAMAASEEGHFDVDLDTDELFNSERMNEIYGFAPGTRFEDRTEYLKRFRFYGNDAETYHAAIRAAVAKGGPERYEFEYRILRPSGEMRWLRTRGKVTRDAEGRARRRTGMVADITEAKLAEQALLQSQERYALAMEAAADGHTDWNLVTGEFYISPRLLRIVGYAQDTTFADRADWVRRFPFHPEDRPKWEAAIAEHFAGRDAKFRMDLRIVVRGETRWVAFTFIAGRDPAGKPVRWTGTITDIHDAKLAEEALRESQERYALAVAGSDDGVWDCDFAARRAFISARARELVGMPPGPEVVPLDEWFASLPLHPDDVPQRAAALHAHLSGETPAYEGEFRLRQPDGVYRWRRLHGLCLRDAKGNPHRMAGSISDVDARRRAEEALRLSEARYALAMEVAEEGHFDWNVQTDEIFASGQALRVIGVPEDAEYRTRGEVMSHVRYHPDDSPRISAEWRDALAGRGTDHEFEYRILRGEEPRTIRGRWKVFRDESGAALRVIGVVADITARKLAEDALRRSEAALRLSEERYALALEAAAEGHFDADLETGEIFVSARLNEIYGFPRQARIANRAEFLNQIPFHPDDRHILDHIIRPDWVRPEWQGPMRDFYEYECRIIPRPGEIRWIHTRGKVTRDAEGRARRRLGVVTDITDRKLAEEALRRSEAALRVSEERYALAMEASAEGHFDTDLETDETFVSARLAEIYGFPRQTRIVDRVEWVRQIPFHPDDRHVLDDVVRPDWEDPALPGRGDLYEFEYRIVVHGETRWIHTRGLVTRDAQGRARRRVGVVTDITDRKLAEEALRLSEERYALAMQASGEGHWDWKIPTDEFYASPRYLELGGFPSDMKYARREDIVPFIPFHPDDRAGYEAAVAAHFAGETPRLDMVIRVTPHGRLRWLHVIGSCTRDAGGRPLRWAGSVSDVTPRKLAEEALQRSEALLLEAQRLAQIGNFTWHVREGEITWSEQIYRIFELEPASPVTLERIATRVHPEDGPMMLDMVERAQQGVGEFEYEHRVLMPDGRIKHVHLIAHRARGAEDRLEYNGAVQDITGRKLAEEALRRSEAALRLSEERYALALEASEEGHFDVDLDTGEIFASARLNEIYGFPRLAKTANRVEYLNQLPFHPDDRHLLPDIASPDWEDPARVARLERYSLRIVPRPGETRWIQTHAAVIRDAQGRARRRVGVISDITERKLAEEALRLSEERYAYAMEAAQDAHWDWIIGTDQYYTSPRVVDVFGLPPGTTFTSRQDYLTKTPLVKEDLDVWLRAARELIAGTGSRLSMELRAIIRGEVRWIQHNGLCVRDASGRAVRWCGSVRDVTDRRRAEEALRQSEERYALAVAGSNEGLFDWDLVSDRVYVSYRAQELFGLPRGELWRPRRDWRHIVTFHPEDAPRLHDSIKAHIEGGAPSYDEEFRIVLPGGGVRWFRQRGIALRDASGKAYRVVGSIGDITERKQAVETLRESEFRFRTLVELNSGGFWVQDENLRYTPSSFPQDITGYPTDDRVGKTRWELCGNLTPLSSSWAEHQAGLAARRPFRDFEYRRLRPDGEIGYYSASGAPFFDDQGRFRGYYGVASDITERKRFEEELRSRKEMLELAQKSARAVPWQWTNGGDPEVNKWSPELSAMFGLPPGAFDGTAEGWWKLCHPDDLPRVKASIAHALATGEIDVEYRVCRPDGKVHWLNQKGRAFFDPEGKPLRSIGFMFDVTERRKVEDELRSRQEMLDLAQKAAQAIAFEFKLGAGEGENRWSADLEAMYGLKPGTYDGSFEAWKKLVYPEDWAAVKEAIQHASRTGDVASEYRVVHPDGSVHWLQAKGRMFFDAAGNATRMVGFMQDITQRKQAEEELRKMEQELRRAQRLEAMGTLAGGIAHDFNNILGAILGYGEMALRDAKKGTRLHRDMDAIMAAGERGRALVDRILAFSRSGVGERVPVHVEEVVREALDQLAAKLPENITISPRLRAGRAAMLGDSTQVHQVVMNLASNAVQAMAQGGALRVSLDTLRIEASRAALIGALSPGEHVVLKVTDAGTGIRTEVLERMFDPFFTTKEVGVGTGLGLSLVHGIVANVGGAIDVATELGKGSTFTVYLPRSGDAPAKAADENRPLPRGEGERVLVVDDEEPLVRLATETLESLGYAPVGFTSSVNALQEFGANPGRFDAILTDERMPGVTGSAIIREVRRINPSIPILLMTGFVGGAAALKARELGADDVLKKPLLARELATSLARVLRP